jgi:hypothetical protein
MGWSVKVIVERVDGVAETYKQRRLVDREDVGGYVRGGDMRQK